MKSFLAMIGLLMTFSSFAKVPDFFCASPKSDAPMEVRYANGGLTYAHDHTVQVAVAHTNNNGSNVKVSGLSTGILLPGSRQSVSIDIDLKTKKGSIRIFTKTFHKQHDQKEELVCDI